MEELTPKKETVMASTPTKKGAANASMPTKNPTAATPPTKMVATPTKQPAAVTTTPTKKVMASNGTKKLTSPKKTTKKAPKKATGCCSAYGNCARHQSLSLKFATTSNAQIIDG